MERKLKLAENVCRVCAAASGVLLLLRSMGDGGGNAMLVRALSLVFLLSIIVGECISRRRRKLNQAAMEKLPRVSDFAEVVRMRTWTALRAGARTISTTAGRTHWYVTFETTNHGVCELEIPWDTYSALRKGMKGRLCFKGNRFIEFKEH